jgi:hypothetical protein
VCGKLLFFVLPVSSGQPSCFGVKRASRGSLTHEYPLAETADLGEIIHPLRETPDDDQDAWLDRSWGTAQAPAVSAPAQPASEPPPQKTEKKKKKRRTPRPTGGQAKEDLEASPLAYLAEFAADEQALYEDSGGEESA